MYKGRTQHKPLSTTRRGRSADGGPLHFRRSDKRSSPARLPPSSLAKLQAHMKRTMTAGSGSQRTAQQDRHHRSLWKASQKQASTAKIIGQMPMRSASQLS